MPNTPNISPGDQVGGRYRLSRAFADGGQASIWLAEDLRTAQHVVLWVPKGAHKHAHALGQIRLDHPNLVKVLDVTHLDDRTPVVVLRYVPGQDLDSWLRTPGTIRTLKQVIAFVAQLADGLAALHGAGYVHRDIKPTNVMVCSDGQTVVLIDLGIALQLGHHRDQHGRLEGSLNSLSPEHLRTPGREVPVSDVFVLGCLLVYAMTGQYPFGEGSSEIIARRILTGDLPSLYALNRGIPPHIRDAIEAATQLDPAARPSAAEFARMLRSGPVSRTAEVGSGRSTPFRCKACGAPRPRHPRPRHPRRCIECGTPAVAVTTTSCLSCGRVLFRDSDGCGCCGARFVDSLWLRVTAGSRSGHRYRIPLGQVTIGRRQLAPNDPYVSRHQFELDTAGGSVIVRPGRGKNSVLIDGQTLTQPRPVTRGTLFRIAGHWGRFE